MSGGVDSKCYNESSMTVNVTMHELEEVPGPKIFLPDDLDEAAVKVIR